MFLNGCALFSNRTEDKVPKIMTHKYKISVLETRTGKPINRAKLLCDAHIKGVNKKELFSDAHGMVGFDISGPYLGGGRRFSYASKLTCTVSKENHLPEKHTVKFSEETRWRWEQEPVWEIFENVRLVDVNGYFCKEILKERNVDFLRKLATLLLEETNDNLILNGICMTDYKTKKYMIISMGATVQYNENRLDDYDVSKRILINPIINYIRGAHLASLTGSEIFGIAFIVDTNIRDFTDDKGSIPSRKISLKYFLPSKSVDDFYNQEITRQELVDNSIILINDDRVALKFQ